MNDDCLQRTLTSRIKKMEAVDWKSFQFLQDETLKTISPEAKQRLRHSLREKRFSQPFYVWQDPQTEVIYCLDGWHRSMVMREMEEEGVKIPETLPATFIECQDKQEAGQLVMIYSSMYAKVSNQGLFDFLGMYDIEYASIREQMNLPDFSTDRFEQKFDFFPVQEETIISADTLSPIVVNHGDIFQINGHRIACGSFKDAALLQQLMDGSKARILNCDPPYNLPADFFLKDNHKVHNHKDFAEGSGEMTDEQFVDFLALIMQQAIDNTVPGALHYIFMDFRHVWHMTEAAKNVYGSPEPKQMCVWNKDIMANGSFYRAKHELCFIFSNEAAKALWNKDLLDHSGFYKNNHDLVFIFKNGDAAEHLSHLDLKDRIRTNVWNYPSANSMANPDRKQLENHPTPKPVQMIVDAILDSTNAGEITLDFFLGSGTSLMACEQTNRLCYGTDIEPQYIQQVIQRYLAFCNKKGIEVSFKHCNGILTHKDFENEPAAKQQRKATTYV